MLFHEVYSKYYYAIAQILTETHKDNLEKPKKKPEDYPSKKEIEKIIEDNTFKDTLYDNDFFKYATKKVVTKKGSAKKDTTKKDATKEDTTKKDVTKKDYTKKVYRKNNIWKTLIQKNKEGKYESRLKHIPEKPLTILEKRWLKSILADPKMKLFFSGQDLEEPKEKLSFLNGIEPLYNSDTFVYYDQHSNADPYEKPNYQEVFRNIIKAKEENKKLNIQFNDSRNKEHDWNCSVKNLEYSEKENKFRVVVIYNNECKTINLSSITSCTFTGNTLPEIKASDNTPTKEEITLELIDKNNALDRVMLSFSDLEKRTEKTEEIIKIEKTEYNIYKVTLYYEKEYEEEIITRILSFGSNLKVTGDENKVKLIKDRIEKQKNLFSTNKETGFFHLENKK